MDWLIWIGALVTLAGLGLLIACILSVLKARRSGLPDAELHQMLQKAVARNLAALFISALGLMMVVTGILLG
jgi:p-aminobenzoyl-glutamate transporter AbgT